MNRLAWRIALLLSNLLDPQNREAAVGDLAEDGARRSVIRDVFGFVLRRQATLWTNWRPWAILIGVAIPFALWLDLISRFASDTTAITIWLYANNWDWNLFGIESFRHDMLIFLGAIPLHLLHLVCWAWSLGLLLGWLSRKTAVFTGTLFCVALLSGPVVVMIFSSFIQHIAGVPASTSPVFRIWFYRIAYPLIVQLALVLPASIAGLKQAAWIAEFRPGMRRTVLIASLIPVVFDLATGLTLGLVDPHSRGLIFRSDMLQLMDLAVYWPVIFWTASALNHRMKMVPS